MKITNNKAFHDFDIRDKFEAGINLTGAEVKAIKLGHADISGSYVRIIGSEAYLLGARIFPYEYARPDQYDAKRTRKLLLHKAEIISLKSKITGSGLTIVPISLYTTHKLIKAELALGKSKKKYQKKEAIKQRDIERDIQTALKNKQ